MIELDIFFDYRIQNQLMEVRVYWSIKYSLAALGWESGNLVFTFIYLMMCDFGEIIYVLPASAPKLYDGRRAVFNCPDSLFQLWKSIQLPISLVLYEVTLYREKVLLCIIFFSLAKNSSKPIDKSKEELFTTQG